ncbi:MAG: GNAT family N-acetyltransferase [Rickettsiales bacterium]|jgi:ribosomal protein S18 acetylase RimI-like enzyme|nr:GNAT family N-acetyltransferase [Rickettsiales bacterium]
MIKVTKYTKLSDILEFIPLFAEKYTDLTNSELIEYLISVSESNGYALLIASIDDKVVGMAAYHIGTMLYCGKFIQVTSLYVKSESRNQGVAHNLLTFIESDGVKQNCNNIVLDSFVTNKDAHEIYFKAGYEVKTYHFMKSL